MRAELKYVVPDAVLPELRAAIAPFVTLDPHGIDYEERGYTVRSIYLDTPTLRYYDEKQQHLQHRKKLRIRGYNDAHADAVVFLEIKRKADDAIGKERAAVRYDALPALLASGRYVPPKTPPRPGAEDAARRFLYHVRRHGLGAVNLVVYEREAFVGRWDDTLRITFDRDLRGAVYPGLDGLFRTDGFRKPLPERFILEVKYDHRFPAWLRPVVARFGLMQRAASKYCLCIDLFERRVRSPAEVRACAPPLSGSPVSPVADPAAEPALQAEPSLS